MQQSSRIISGLLRGSPGLAAMRSGFAAHASVLGSPSAIRTYAASASSDNPVYVVFGASGGIGSALAQRLQGQSGAKVILVDSNKQGLDKLRQSDDAEAHECDATDTKQVESVIERVVKQHGGLHGVANCVGNVQSRSPAATSLADLDAELKVNLHSAFNVVQASSKAMLNTGGGAIVLVSAAVAQVGIPNFESMAASKAAVEGMSRSVAATYASRGIRVNCVAPGLTKTGETEHLTEKPRTSEASKQVHPAKRFAEASDVAAALAFLMGPDSQFITGQVLAVDGGLTRLQPQPASN